MFQLYKNIAEPMLFPAIVSQRNWNDMMIRQNALCSALHTHNNEMWRQIDLIPSNLGRLLLHGSQLEAVGLWCLKLSKKNVEPTYCWVENCQEK